jgi:hypothetical protein
MAAQQLRQSGASEADPPSVPGKECLIAALTAGLSQRGLGHLIGGIRPVLRRVALLGSVALTELRPFLSGAVAESVVEHLDQPKRRFSQSPLWAGYLPSYWDA